MTMKTLEELFEHELKDMYFAEHVLVKALEKLEKESTSSELKAGFRSHKTETKNQIKRLEKIFKHLDITPKQVRCDGIMGLVKEKDMFAKEKPSKEILQDFNVTAATKAERYEISAYESMIRMATKMGKDEVIELLEQNLEEEVNALGLLEEFADNSV